MKKGPKPYGRLALMMALSFLPVVADAKVAADTALTKGREIFDRQCASCHGSGIGNPGNPYKPGTDALRVKYAGSVPMLLTQRTDLTPEVIEYFVRHGVSIMPYFRKTEIDDEQLSALAAYLTRNNGRRDSRRK